MRSISVGVQAMMLRESFQSIGAYETLDMTATISAVWDMK